MSEEIPRIPDYEILRCIGAGGYGRVFLARNFLGGYCAIKFVRRAGSDDRAYERELNGLRLFADISRLHEGFVDVLHLGRDDAEGYFYYVMELGDPLSAPEGFDPGTYAPRTLQGDLDRRRSLPPAECVRLGMTLSSALAFLHQRGLVHRDVKPANIIFVHDLPRLADPGLVSQVASQMSAVGTLGFMDPATHGQKLGDIYSLGRLLYVAATGLPVNQFPSLPTLAAETKEEFLELNEVLLRAGASEPTARYQSMEDLVAHLALLQAGESLRTGMRLARWWRGLRRYSVWLVALVLLAVLSAWQVLQLTKQAGELRERRVGSYLAYGTAAVDSQNYFEALPWFVAALELEQSNSERARKHRLRIGSTSVASPRLVQMWSGPEHQFIAQFSPDGQQVVFPDTNQCITTLDIARGVPVSRVCLKATPDEPLVALSPNGRLAITAGKTNGASLWNATNGELLLALPRPPDPASVIKAAFTPNSERLAIVNATGGVARLVDCASGRSLREYDLPRLVIEGLAWNASGSLLAVSSRSNGVMVLDFDSRQLVSTFYNHSNWVFDAAFSPQPPFVASGGYDRFARLWSHQTGLEVYRLAHEGAVGGVAFSPNGERVATAGMDNLARIFDARSGRGIGSPLPHESKVAHIAFSCSGDLLTVSLGGTLRVWALDTAYQPSSAPCLTASAQGGRLAWCDASNTVVVVQTRGGQPVQRWTVAGGPIKSLLFDANGEKLLTCAQPSYVEGRRLAHVALWDASSGHPAGQPFDIPAECSRKVLRPDGLRLAAVEGKTLCIWDTVSGESLAVAPLQSTNTQSLAWHPAADRVALGVGFHALIYDVALGRFLWAAPIPHSMAVAAVGFSPDGRLLATASADNTMNPGEARVWDADTGAPRSPALRHKDGVRDVVFSPDGRRVATAGEDFTAMVWEVADGRTAGRPLRQPDEILAVCFSAARPWLATGCRNGDARVWDLETSEPLTPPLRQAGRIVRVQFVEDDTALLTENADGVAKLWRLAFDERPLKEIQSWARILSAERSGPSDPTPGASRPSLAEEFRKLNPVSTRASPRNVRP